MTENEHRQLSRDSLFLMAELRLAGDDAPHRVKVRNLSAGGMMAEGPLKTVRGTLIEVNIRNIGWIGGSIAWVQGDRCGIAFNQDIDPLVARAPVVAGETTPRFVKPPMSFGAGEARLRKI
ncbi:MAG TPA: PilZ domain-containing protein [Novosphingobium sp.]|nr:PilZ domain-containing protein [Novosphingobium sp.]